MLLRMVSRRRTLRRSVFVLCTVTMGTACAYDFGAVPDPDTGTPPDDAGGEQGIGMDATDTGVDGYDGPGLDTRTPDDNCSTGQGCNPKDGPPPMDTCSSTGCMKGTCCDVGPPDVTMDAFDPCSIMGDGSYCGGELKGMFSPNDLYYCKMGLLSSPQTCKYGCVPLKAMSMCASPG
jgi:hypothetical protein